ncbi:MAG: hypothetical protein AAGA53_16320 [Pseudomonadota bacterium]
MIRLIAKLTGMLFLVLAVITAVLDLTRTIANSSLTMTALGEEWFKFNSASLNSFQVGIERHLGLPWLWSSVVQNILLLPSWVVFFVLALLILWLARRPERRWQKRFGR